MANEIKIQIKITSDTAINVDETLLHSIDQQLRNQFVATKRKKTQQRICGAILKYIIKTGARGATEAELARSVRAYRLLREHDRVALLDVLKAEHGIRLVTIQTKTRPRRAWVASDVCTAR